MRFYKNLFDQIISPENLFSAWDAFRIEKRKKPDVIEFEWKLEENIFKLHRELKSKAYKHGSYAGFYIHDPKQRHIHKAPVRDRVLHHAVFSVINPLFEKTFIPNSFSCRIGYGTHKGVDALAKMTRKVQKNGANQCLILKCDIQNFFGTVDHEILISLLKKRIQDGDAMWLLEEIIESFSSSHSTVFASKGLPIGNLTSQLFANIYMNEFDQFMKHDLKVKYYVRYTDDFVIVSKNREYVDVLLPRISEFLEHKLLLKLHPKKVSVRKLHKGIDFLGYIQFPHHRLLRTRTKQRIFKRVRRGVPEQSLQSYLGVLSHANSHKLASELKNLFWFNQENKKPHTAANGYKNKPLPLKNQDGWMDGWMDGNGNLFSS